MPFRAFIAYACIFYFFYIMESAFPKFHYEFGIRNSGKNAVIVKNITVDGIVYLDHDLTINPSCWFQPIDDIQCENTVHFFRVFRPQVKKFEMVTEENGQEITYSCDLILNKTGSHTFSIRLADGRPLTSPLESISFFD